MREGFHSRGNDCEARRNLCTLPFLSLLGCALLCDCFLVCQYLPMGQKAPVCFILSFVQTCVFGVPGIFEKPKPFANVQRGICCKVFKPRLSDLFAGLLALLALLNPLRSSILLKRLRAEWNAPLQASGDPWFCFQLLLPGFLGNFGTYYLRPFWDFFFLGGFWLGQISGSLHRIPRSSSVERAAPLNRSSDWSSFHDGFAALTSGPSGFLVRATFG